MSPFRTFLIALGVAVGSVVAITLAWTAIGGGELTLHGWIALSLGVLGTVALAWVLMALAFKSDRDGWDDRADRTGSADVETPDKP